MKLRIGETLFDVEDAIGHPKMRDMKYLIAASRKDGTPVTPSTLQQLFATMQTAFESGDGGAGLLSDEQVLGQLQGLVWLCRRAAGEDLTYDAAGDFDMTDWGFEDDEEPVEETPLVEAVVGAA